MAEVSRYFQSCDRNSVRISMLYIYISTHCGELTKLVGSRNNLSLLYMMELMVPCFVIDSHKVKPFCQARLSRNVPWGCGYLNC